MPEPEAPSEQPEPAATAPQAPAEPLSRTLDPRSLRAIAHPLRIQLLRALRRYGPATASQLAERLGESSGATSYHLRQLAAHGFIVDDPTRGKGRERWWKAVHRGTIFDETLHKNPDPEVQGALDVVMHEIATIHTQELSTWVATRHTWGEEWYGASDFSDFRLNVTPDRLRELNRKIHALIDEYSETSDPDAPGAARVRMHLHAFPQHD
ncbi:winged helix-turn-helix domain-containing protein [Streptomyces sp. SP18ES09]|uniref:ArsR/SmtB family transcription factor n=1 Tax=Streptomyces sp. SP18ES09 TaxID=3002532 RepID=UPI002E790D90|nr:winged helix-turn-helix domain-containing protein [Streptomyces sp. SP18ES09]MEE1814875.1 winged helix-turn-helix domain-containing protein [Streptomyces sp. SP18ES09]